MTEKEDIKAESEDMTAIEIVSWPDLNFEKWKKWGFEPSEILRTPRYNFLTQPVKTSMSRKEKPSPAFVFEGLWYRVNQSIENRIGSMIFPSSMLLMILVILLLLSVRSDQKYVAVFCFLAIYLIVEGFLPLSLKIVARNFRTPNVEIPWKTINKVVLLPKPEILLIGWNDETARCVAVQLHKDMGQKLFDLLKVKSSSGTVFQVLDQRSVHNPPK